MEPRKFRQGSALIFVLWTVVFLAAATLSLGRQTRMGLTFIDRHLQEVQAKAVAWAGVINAIDRMRNETPDRKSGTTLYECAVHFSDGENPGTSLDAELADDRFEVSYAQDNHTFTGLQDEERKINVNAINGTNIKVLEQLARLCGLNEDEAALLVRSVSGQIKAGHKFVAVEEIAAKPELTSYLTVYPKSPLETAVDLNTAPRLVLQALARSLTDQTIGLEDADGLVGKMLAFRAGDDGREGTADDRALDFSAMGLNSVEKILAERLPAYRARQPDYVRIRSKGTQKKTAVVLEAVIYVPDLSVISWSKE
jgi:type II secretory pathway component PulK